MDNTIQNTKNTNFHLKMGRSGLGAKLNAIKSQV